MAESSLMIVLLDLFYMFRLLTVLAYFDARRRLLKLGTRDHQDAGE
jgi:hypothetical protein